MSQITSQELRLFIPYVYELCGVVLDDKKSYLLESRLEPVMRDLQCDTFNDLYNKAQHNREIAGKIIDAICTHETFFFREPALFKLLQDHLVPEHFERARLHAKAHPPSLTLLSAACSTGQEAYSTAIALKECLGQLSAYRINIVGADISEAAIRQARLGSYNKAEIGRGLSPEQIRKYVVADGDLWRINDELRRLTAFRALNLLQPLPGLGTFDIIFCRNVAIYFSPEDRGRLFDRLADLLNPGGVLILGSTETLIDGRQRYERRPDSNAVYVRVR